MERVEQAWPPPAVPLRGRRSPWETAHRATRGRFVASVAAARRVAAGLAWGTWLPGALLALALTTPAWAPILRPDLSLWQLYDGGNHLRKAFFLAQSIKDGNWYPRWTPQEYGGYGYPTLNFYAPGMYYAILALAAALPGAGLYGALQILGALEEVAIIGGVYALACSAWRHQPAAVLAAGAVAYGPYIFPNLLYLSGWLPQLIGLALLVWLLVECLWLWRRVSEGQPAGQWWLAIALTT